MSDHPLSAYRTCPFGLLIPRHKFMMPVIPTLTISSPSNDDCNCFGRPRISTVRDEMAPWPGRSSDKCWQGTDEQYVPRLSSCERGQMPTGTCSCVSTRDYRVIHMTVPGKPTMLMPLDLVVHVLLSIASMLLLGSIICEIWRVV